MVLLFKCLAWIHTTRTVCYQLVNIELRLITRRDKFCCFRFKQTKLVINLLILLRAESLALAVLAVVSCQFCNYKVLLFVKFNSGVLRMQLPLSILVPL